MGDVLQDASKEQSDHRALPGSLVWSGWVLLVFIGLGALAGPSFNIHEPSLSTVFVVAAALALWAIPVYFVACVVLLRRASRLGLRATRLEVVQTTVFGVMCAGWIALCATS
jgi:hypothetical protein